MAASLTRVYNLAPEQLRGALDKACRSFSRHPAAEWPPACPACEAAVGRDAGFCTACGQQLFAAQPPAPRRARGIRVKAFVVTLLVAMIPVGGLVAVFAKILSS